MIALTNAPEAIAYIERRLGITISEPRRVIGFVSNAQRPLCAFAFSNYTEGANIEMTVVAEPGGITRGVMRYLANYVFNKLGCRRITIHTKRRNELAKDMALRFGFKQERVAKHHFADDDAMVFRMLKSECRFLHG